MGFAWDIRRFTSLGLRQDYVNRVVHLNKLGSTAAHGEDEREEGAKCLVRLVERLKFLVVVEL